MAEAKHVLQIEYCAPCNFLDLALALEREVLAQWAPIIKEVKAIPSAGGMFEVTLNGELIFSNWALGRHALPGEVSALVAERIGPPLEEFIQHGPESVDARGAGVHDPLPSRA